MVLKWPTDTIVTFILNQSTYRCLLELLIENEICKYSHNKMFVHKYILGGSFLYDNIDSPPLPDTLDVFEMQRRRHDLAFFSTIKSWARMAKIKSQKPFLHGWHKGWLMYGWHNQGRHEFFPVLSLSQHCEWPPMHSTYLGYELFFLPSYVRVQRAWKV